MNNLKLCIAALMLALPVAANATTMPLYEADGLIEVDGQPGVDPIFGTFTDEGVDDIDISLFFEADGPSLSTASLLVSDFSDGGILLEASMFLGFSTNLMDGAADTATLTFGELEGSLPGAQPEISSVDVIFSFTDENAVSDGFGGFSVAATVQIFATEAPAPVPLPATLPLLLVGLGGVAALRRRTRQAYSV